MNASGFPAHGYPLDPKVTEPFLSSHKKGSLRYESILQDLVGDSYYDGQDETEADDLLDVDEVAVVSEFVVGTNRDSN